MISRYVIEELISIQIVDLLIAFFRSDEKVRSSAPAPLRMTPPAHIAVPSDLQCLPAAGFQNIQVSRSH